MKALTSILEGYFDNIGVEKDARSAVIMKNPTKNFNDALNALCNNIKGIIDKHSMSTPSMNITIETIDKKIYNRGLEVFTTLLENDWKIYVEGHNTDSHRYTDVRIYQYATGDEPKTISIIPIFVRIEPERAFRDFLKFVFLYVTKGNTKKYGLTSGNFEIVTIQPEEP